MKYRIWILFLCTTFVVAKRYTLPGDTMWPNSDAVKILSDNLAGKLTTPASSNFEIPFTWNWRAGPPTPAFVVKASNEEDIATSLRFASQHAIRVAIRSTGHHQDTRNTADNALVIDLSALNSIRVDKSAKRLTVGPGATWGRIGQYLRDETGGTLVAISGSDPGVGAAGWTFGGGHGRLTRLFGLGVDAVLSFRVVLTNGTAVTATPSVNSDLFRALAGAGASSFGVVSELTFQLFDDPGPVTTFAGAYYASDETAEAFQEFMRTAPNNTGAYYILTFFGAAPIVQLSAYCLGDSTECFGTLSALRNIADCFPLAVFNCAVRRQQYDSYTEYFAATTADGGNKGGDIAIYIVSTALDFEQAGQLAVANKLFRDYAASPWPNATLFCSGNAVLGGASKFMDQSRARTSVSPAMRNGRMGLSCGVAYQPGTSRADLVARMDEWADTELRPRGVDGWVFWNEPQHNVADWQARYWGGAENYGTLRLVKDKYDPDNVLTCHHCVGWEDVENVDPPVCPARCSCSNALQKDTCVNNAKLSSSNLLQMSTVLSLIFATALVILM